MFKIKKGTCKDGPTIELQFDTIEEYIAYEEYNDKMKDNTSKD